MRTILRFEHLCHRCFRDSAILFSSILQIRRKIKMEIIQPNLVDKIVEQFPSILMLYSSIFFELMDIFLRDKNQMLANFASNAFK